MKFMVIKVYLSLLIVKNEVSNDIAFHFSIYVDNIDKYMIV